MTQTHIIREETLDRTKDVERFWRHIFGGQRGMLQVFTAKRGANGKLGNETVVYNNFPYPGAAESAAEWALEKSCEDRREVYYCAHLLKAAQPNKENAAEVSTLWGDLDGTPVPNGNLKATAVLASSPGRFHCSWRLTDPVPPAIAEELNRRLAKEIGADPSGADLTQLLRVPLTTNHKYPDSPEVRIVSLDASASYHPAVLDGLLPKSDKPQTEHQADESHGDEPPVVLSPEAMKVWRGASPRLKEGGEVDKSATLLHIGRMLYDAGANRRVVVAGVHERDIALGYRKYSNNRDGGTREYERIFEKLQASGRNGRVRVIFGEGEPSRTPQPQWPEMDAAAYRGIFGEIVELVEPEIEGDPVGVLTGAIVAVGSAMGHGPHFQIGATKHRTNLFVGHLGETSRGRKGSSWGPVRDIMHAADRRWTEERIASGLSSGEGLIAEVRDPVHAPDGDGGTKIVDNGVEDKRLLVMESELSQALKVMKREGNTLSPVMRNAWDGETLRTFVKHSPHRATDPMISIVGHVTLAELTSFLTETEMANGLANRFMWFLVRRSKRLPEGGNWHMVNLAPVTRKLVGVLEYANRNFRRSWGEDALGLWCQAYEVLTEDRPGMFGAITARAEAQVLRLAMLYALADCSAEIRRTHVESALAVWEYAEASALYCFGEATGDPDADKALVALRAAGGSLTRTEVSEVFGRNRSRQELDRIREALIKVGKLRVTHRVEAGSKKPLERWEVA